jgi:heat shock protein HslJ
LLSLALMGCASSPSTTSSAAVSSTPGSAYFQGSEWRLKDLGGTPVNPDAVPTMAFLEPGKISGNASCNRYSGPVELGDGTIHVGTLASTRMACPPDVAPQESAFLGALQNADRVVVEGQELLVYTRSLERPLRFERR